MNKGSMSRAKVAVVLSASLALGAGGSAGADKVTDALRPVSEIVQKGNSILAAACDGYKKASGNSIVQGLAGKLLGASGAEQLLAIGDAACRLSEMTSDIGRILSQDSWIGMGRSAMTKLAQGMSPDQQGVAKIADQLLAGFESGAVDTQAMMQSVTQAYMDRYMKSEKPVKSSVTVEGGVSTDPEQPGVVGSDGKLMTGPGESMLFDPDASAALFGVRSSLNGLGSVYANQAGSTQAMENTAKNLQKAAESAQRINGNPLLGDPGIAATRVHEVETAASMREQMNVMVKSNSDMMRIVSQGDVAVLGQLAQSAKLQSATNSILATDVELKLRDRKEAAEAQIAAYKEEVRRSYQGYRDTMRNATGIMDYRQYVAKGSGFAEFSWMDISGLSADPNERAYGMP